MIKLCTFSTIPDFWHYFQYLNKPSNFIKKPQPQVLQLFRDSIKPAWEDENNRNGGKWLIRVKKEFTNRFWEELVLAFIGEQLSYGLYGSGGNEDDIKEVCGIVLTIRDHDIISVWNRNSNDETIRDRLRDRIKNILRLPVGTHMEYKPHQIGEETESRSRIVSYKVFYGRNPNFNIRRNYQNKTNEIEEEK